MKACGITDVGLQRHENQDTFAVERGAADGQLIAVVCDGMGGENCGQIASSLAVRTFLDELHAVLRTDMTTEQLREAVSFCVSKANAAVNRHAQEHTECHGMGTTLVSATDGLLGLARTVEYTPTTVFLASDGTLVWGSIVGSPSNLEKAYLEGINATLAWQGKDAVVLADVQ